MGTLAEILAILANAVIHGTDVFVAIVLRPALAAVDDRPLTRRQPQLSRRLPSSPSRRSATE